MDTTFDAFAADLAALLPQVAAAPNRYRAQALCRVVGQPDADWTYRVDPAHPEREYIYPASRIKLVLAIAALERINQLAHDTGLPIDETTPLSYQPLFDEEIVEDRDSGDGEFPSGQPITLKRLIWRAIVASENEPSNKLYEFVGWNGMKEWAERHAIADLRVEHRLSEFRTLQEQRCTPRIMILSPQQTIEIPELSPDASEQHTRVDGSFVIGSAYRDPHGILISGGMDFSFKNRFGLCAAIDVLERLSTQRFHLTGNQYEFLTSAMRTPPHFSTDPKYPDPTYSTARFKTMLAGLSQVRPSHEWLILNKAGEAYGFTSDVATIRHLPTGRTAHAAASIWCCASGVLNADEYEYDSVGKRFLQIVGAHVGRLLTT